MINYQKALYRRNNFGEPCVWYAREAIGKGVLYHGIVGKKIHMETFVPKGKATIEQEIASRYNAKRKVGYKLLSELKDNNGSPVEEKDIYNFLITYLPHDRSNFDNNLLPMLAKVYDNTNNKLFKNGTTYYGQWKINGLRCFIGAERIEGDLFKHKRLTFQSREGAYWKGFDDLEHYLLRTIPNDFVNRMIEEHICLDGELYLPGHSVNEINHFVKNPDCYEHKLLQFWCYDIAVGDISQAARLNLLDQMFGSSLLGHKVDFADKEEHLNNKERFILLPSISISNDDDASRYKNIFISKGFEGLIMRDVYAEYQYGKRNKSMIKYKSHTDGKFIIVDVYPEGTNRRNIPLLRLRNDINDEEFEVHASGSFDYQEGLLARREVYIGKYAVVEFGERSGVKQVPFHVKKVTIVE